MLRGEGGDLQSDRMATLEPGLAKKKYLFQIRNSDGREHFCRLSRQFLMVCLFSVYFDPNNPPSGSFFIPRAGGAAMSYRISCTKR